MKKLILIILLLPLFATAQINGTIQKTVATTTLRGSFGSSGVDTIPSVTGTFTNGYILKYNSTLKKWYASADAVGTVTSITPAYGLTPQSAITTSGTFRVDTTAIQTVSNFFPKGDTRYPLKNGTGATGTWGIGISGTAANSTLWNNQQYSGTTLTTAPTAIMAFDGSMYRPTSAAGIQSFLGITGGPFLPLTGGTLSGGLSGTTGAFSGRVIAGGGDGNGVRVPSNESSGFAPTDGLSLTTAFNVAYLTNKNNGSFRPMYYDALSHNFNTLVGTGDRMVTADANGNLGATQIVTSGTYTPTLTNVANVTSSTLVSASYIRIGNQVQVEAVVTVTPTTGSGAVATIDLSLPVASNFASSTDLRGGIGGQVNNSVSVIGGVGSADTVNDRASFSFYVNTGGVPHYSSVHFQYTVL